MYLLRLSNNTSALRLLWGRASDCYTWGNGTVKFSTEPHTQSMRGTCRCYLMWPGPKSSVVLHQQSKVLPCINKVSGTCSKEFRGTTLVGHCEAPSSFQRSSCRNLLTCKSGVLLSGTWSFPSFRCLIHIIKRTSISPSIPTCTIECANFLIGIYLHWSNTKIWTFWVSLHSKVLFTNSPRQDGLQWFLLS